MLEGLGNWGVGIATAVSSLAKLGRWIGGDSHRDGGVLEGERAAQNPSTLLRQGYAGSPSPSWMGRRRSSSVLCPLRLDPAVHVGVEEGEVIRAGSRCSPRSTPLTPCRPCGEGVVPAVIAIGFDELAP